MKIVTGATGQAHVTAADDGALHTVLFDKMYDSNTGNVSAKAGTYVLPIGDVLGVEAISTSKVRIKSGDIMMQGRHGRIPHGTYDELTIENGTTGYNRNDLIVCHYENNDGVESMKLKVVKGTPTTGIAKDPTYTTGNILVGDTEVDYPLYRVKLSGINISQIDKIFSLWTPSATHSHTMDQIQGKLPLDRTSGNLSLNRTSGVLPIEKGGTGATTVSDARKNILGNQALWISEGGTGATTTWQARRMLVSPHILDTKIKENFTIPTTFTTVPFIKDDSKWYVDNLFTVDSGKISRNASNSSLKNEWPDGAKKVLVEFCVYLYKGFTAGEQVQMYMYRNGKAFDKKWIYYVKAASPYTMFTGSSWVTMNDIDYLEFKIKCTSGKGSIGYGDGTDTRLTITTWD